MDSEMHVFLSLPTLRLPGNHHKFIYFAQAQQSFAQTKWSIYFLTKFRINHHVPENLRLPENTRKWLINRSLISIFRMLEVTMFSVFFFIWETSHSTWGEHKLGKQHSIQRRQLDIRKRPTFMGTNGGTVKNVVAQITLKDYFITQNMW